MGILILLPGLVQKSNCPDCQVISPKSRVRKWGQRRQARMTLTPLRVNAPAISSEATVSVTNTSTASIGQIREGVTTPSLLESATTITCFACFTIARNDRASSDSFVGVPRRASIPEPLRNSLSRKMPPIKLIAAAPVKHNHQSHLHLPAAQRSLSPCPGSKTA